MRTEIRVRVSREEGCLPCRYRYIGNETFDNIGADNRCVASKANLLLSRVVSHSGSRGVSPLRPQAQLYLEIARGFFASNTVPAYADLGNRSFIRPVSREYAEVQDVCTNCITFGRTVGFHVCGAKRA